MDRYFNADGTERPIVQGDPEEPLELIAELGGQFEECRFKLTFSHDELRREEISAVLGLTPTKAWNAGERHPLGNGAGGRTRVVDWGLWYLTVEVESGDITDAVEQFLLAIPTPVEEWRRLALMWTGRVEFVGHTSNFNREFWVSPALLKLLADRGLGLVFDAYFDGSDDDVE